MLIHATAIKSFQNLTVLLHPILHPSELIFLYQWPLPFLIPVFTPRALPLAKRFVSVSHRVEPTPINLLARCSTRQVRSYYTYQTFQEGRE